jgi:CubicO group peptidase (beta-lactamase class C family)
MAGHHSWKLCLWLSLLILIVNTAVLSVNGSSGGYWPGKNWRTSTPEAQGMDSGKIYEMLKTIAKGPKSIHSLLIIRNGYLVTEAYFSPYHKNTKQLLCNSSKSISSALIGVAIREGFIKNLHQKVWGIFPEYAIKKLDERKKALTIEDLLSMFNGEGRRYSWQDYYGLQSIEIFAPMSEEYIHFLLDRLNNDISGSYNDQKYISEILEAIIQKTSKKVTLPFAREYLFKPIGVKDIGWPANNQGINWCAGELCITPQNMARFGYLFLRQGIWNEKRVVPTEWVKTSSKERIYRVWNPTLPTDTYGCHYWIEPYGLSMRGLEGQYILAIPNSDMVLVFTGSASGDLVSTLIEMFIIPAVKSNRCLPENQKMANKLKQFLREIEYPRARPVPKLPKTVAQINGKVYFCEPNQGFIQTISFHFQSGNVCWITGLLAYDRNTEFRAMVGLEGVYRLANESEESDPRVYKGYWVDKKTFVISYQDLRHPEQIDLRFVFEGNRVEVEVTGSMHGVYEKFEGRTFD